MRHLFRSLHRASFHSSDLAVAMIIGLSAASGCQKPEPPPMAYMGPTLASADLGLVKPVEADPNGFVILETGTSRGRFPAGLAVIRLDQPNPLFVCDDHLFVVDHGWEVATLKAEEGVYWNNLLSTMPQSRGVFVMDRKSFVAPDCDLDQVLRSVRRHNVELCLIYGPRLVDDGEAGLAGVLVDVATGEPTAYIQAQAGPLDFEPPRPDRPKHDRSHVDVNYIAARRFEREVRKCLCELITRDQPATTTQPSPWRHTQDLRVPADSVPVYIVPNRRVGG